MPDSAAEAATKPPTADPTNGAPPGAPPTDAPPTDAPPLAAVFPGDSEMARRCRAFDWAATPLGLAHRWPQSLRTTAALVLASGFPSVVLWGPALVQLYNDAAAPFLGVKHPAALGVPTREVWPEVWAVVAPIYARVQAGETVTLADQCFAVARHGPAGPVEELYATITYAPVRDEAGAVGGVWLTFVDTTAQVEGRAAGRERERLLAALGGERARLADAFQRAPSFMVVYRGPRHVYEFVNEAYYGLVGHRPVLGRPLDEAIPEAREQGFTALLDQVLATGAPLAFRETPVWLERTAGAPRELRYVDMVFQPLAEAEAGGPGADRVTGVLAHGVDITEHVLARRENERLLAESEAARRGAEAARADAEAARRAAEQARERATEANQAKSQFLATMSHELRTPLNAIAGYAQLLELGVAGPTTPAQRDYLTRLATAGRHLLGLVDDVLDLAKVDAGEMALAREPATTAAAVASALDLVRPQAVARGVALAEAGPDAPAPPGGVPYVGDEHRVRQILANLLSNAVKFTAPGGTVAVACALVPETPPAARLHGAGPWATVRVADTGVGIAPAHQAAVFEPFYQVERGHTRTKGGTGLGLAISRRLARLMGGDLTLESALGAGSAFTLWLPSAGGAAWGEGGAEETAVARVVRAAHGRPGLVRGLGELGDLLRRQLAALVDAYAAQLRAEPAAPLARGMKRAELEDHIVTTLADLAQSLVIVGEAGSAEAGLLADSMAINAAVAERHGGRRHAQGWTLDALRADYAAWREVLARAVRADARAGGADAEAALAVLLDFVEQSEARAVAAWRAADERATPPAAPAPPDGP